MSSVFTHDSRAGGTLAAEARQHANSGDGLKSMIERSLNVVVGEASFPEGGVKPLPVAETWASRVGKAENKPQFCKLAEYKYHGVYVGWSGEGKGGGASPPPTTAVG